MTVLVFSAHPDDEVIGLGGTIKKISKNEDVITIIFSYGDKFPFWRNYDKVMRIRKKLPELTYVDYNDHERITGKKKADTLFKGI